MGFKTLKITVGMQQRNIMLDTPGGDEKINSSAMEKGLDWFWLSQFLLLTPSSAACHSTLQFKVPMQLFRS